MTDEPVFIEGQYRYPCGYRSDYKFETATQARFYDTVDRAVSVAIDEGASLDDTDGWLFNLATDGWLSLASDPAK